MKYFSQLMSGDRVRFPNRTISSAGMIRALAASPPKIDCSDPDTLEIDRLMFVIEHPEVQWTVDEQGKTVIQNERDQVHFELWRE